MAMLEQTTIIEVQPLPGFATPVQVRERHALKALLRRFGLKCLSIRDVAAKPGEVAAGPAVESSTEDERE